MGVHLLLAGVFAAFAARGVDSHEDPYTEHTRTNAYYGMVCKLTLGFERFKVADSSGKKFDDVPGMLLKDLRSKDAVKQQAAVDFLIFEATVTRLVAWDRDRDDSADIVPIAFGEFTAPIQVELERLAKTATGERKLMIQSLLMLIHPDDTQCTERLLDGLHSMDVVQRRAACSAAINYHPTRPLVVKALVEAVSDSDLEVRTQALKTLCFFPEKAENLVPALVSALKSKSQLYEEIPQQLVGYADPFGKKSNLALVALSLIGESARPALPEILRRLEQLPIDAPIGELRDETLNSKDPAEHSKLEKREDLRIECLRCLGCLREVSKLARPQIKRFMKSKIEEVRTSAAVSIANIDPTDEDAIKIIVDGLHGDTKLKKAMLGSLVIGPKVPQLLDSLIPNLRDGDSEIRNTSIHIIGNMGDAATRAIPALKARATSIEFGNVSNIHACRALGKLGKEGIAALVELASGTDENAKGRAMLELASVAKDHPKTLSCLMNAVTEREGLWTPAAVRGLALLRNRAAPARKLLEHVRDQDQDHETRMLAAWALTQIDRK